MAEHILTNYTPTVLSAYYEPFFGGGAVYFKLFQNLKITTGTKVVLNDLNRPLMETYVEIQLHPDSVFSELRQLADSWSEDNTGTFDRVRHEWNAGKQSAARHIFLRQSSFNGLWRENKSGQMNAPAGRYERLSLPSLERIKAVAGSLRHAEVRTGEWLKALPEEFVDGTFIFCDPPYLGGFSAYTGRKWSIEDLTSLVVEAKSMADRGATVVLTHAVNDDLLAILKAKWPRHRKEAYGMRRRINSDPTKRGKVPEWIITGEKT